MTDAEEAFDKSLGTSCVLGSPASNEVKAAYYQGRSWCLGMLLELAARRLEMWNEDKGDAR